MRSTEYPSSLQSTKCVYLVWYVRQSETQLKKNTGGAFYWFVKSMHFWQYWNCYAIAVKVRCILGHKNTNRKPCTIYRMILFSMTFSDLWFSRSRHFWSQISEKRCILKTKLLFHTNRKLYLTYGMVLFGDLDWPLSASRGFVSINWASCHILIWTYLKNNLHNVFHF